MGPIKTQEGAPTRSAAACFTRIIREIALQRASAAAETEHQSGLRTAIWREGREMQVKRRRAICEAQANSKENNMRTPL